MLNEIGDTLVTSLNNDLQAVISFIPRFVAGLVVLLIGIIVASVVKQLVLSFFKSLKIEFYLRRYGVPEMRPEYSWGNILSEIGRWFVIIVFLVPTADVWGLPRIGNLLNELLLYIPNVFVAAVIGLVGFVLAKLAHDVVLASVKGLTADNNISIFVILVVLDQLGVASDMLRILFTGIVAMLALAGGIAFGFGGQDTARDILGIIRKRLK
ncbi:MAG: Conserved TM helix repeat-containing protein [Candidatus Levybacteria bacterium GW2011_GWC2_40_7]|nr:MAG: Conserved TM helix repeat-containing protein [Candidatus Levybacteria bacterium GW2011_GWC2_40_7]